jgi:hypothetical protein
VREERREEVWEEDACMALDGLWDVSTMSTMTPTKVEKNIAITIHDTLITHTVL